jgi:hypothetical protein
MHVEKFEIMHLDDFNFKIQFEPIQNFEKLKLCLAEKAELCYNLTNSSIQTMKLEPNEYIMFGMTPKFYVKTIGIFTSCNEKNEDLTIPKNVTIGKSNIFFAFKFKTFKIICDFKELDKVKGVNSLILEHNKIQTKIEHENLPRKDFESISIYCETTTTKIIQVADCIKSLANDYYDCICDKLIPFTNYTISFLTRKYGYKDVPYHYTTTKTS